MSSDCGDSIQHSTYDADTVHANDERIRQRFFAEGIRLMGEIVNGFAPSVRGERGMLNVERLMLSETRR